MEEQFQYDFLGNLTEQTDANQNVTHFQYDALNRLTRVTNALGENTDYSHDRLGGLSQIQQYEGPSTFTTTRQYDERGVLISKQLPQGNLTTYQYNALGLPVQITDPMGKTTTLQYYPDNRRSEIEAENNGVTSYYSPLGLTEKYEVWNDAGGPRQYGEALSYQYYSSGRTKQRSVADFTAGFQYDPLGNRTRVTDPFGMSAAYQYDSLNRLTTVTADGRTFTYEYYPDSMIKAVNYPNGVRAEYTNDNINRLKTLVNKAGGQAISQYAYDYDNNGNIISVTGNGQTTNYTYDALNRQTGIQRPGGEQVLYDYDTRGNRTVQAGGDSPAQNFIPGEFSYNAWDRLSGFTADGAAYQYEYDPEGLRTKKTGPSGSVRYHCDNLGRVIAESSDSGVTAQNIWGYQALARKVGGVYYYYLYNGHGDVVQVLDQNGNIANSYTYDEWGNILSRQEQLPQPLKYAGEYYDEESGLYYLRARYYDPAVGRFISRDSYEGSITNPLSLNPYTYVENNPLGNIDPSGHFSIGAIIGGAVIKAVVKVVVKAVTSSSSSHKSKGGSSNKGSSSGGGSSSYSGGSSSSGSGGSSSGIISSIGSAAASFIGGFVDLVGGIYSDHFSKGSSEADGYVLLASTDTIYSTPRYNSAANTIGNSISKSNPGITGVNSSGYILAACTIDISDRGRCYKTKKGLT